MSKPQLFNANIIEELRKHCTHFELGNHHFYLFNTATSANVPGLCQMEARLEKIPRKTEDILGRYEKGRYVLWCENGLAVNVLNPGLDAELARLKYMYERCLDFAKTQKLKSVYFAPLENLLGSLVPAHFVDLFGEPVFECFRQWGDLNAETSMHIVQGYEESAYSEYFERKFRESRTRLRTIQKYVRAVFGRRENT